MHLRARTRHVNPRRSLDTGEITRRFIYKMQLSWTSSTGRLPLIVEITGRRCLFVVCSCCAVLTRGGRSSTSMHGSAVGSNARFREREEMQLD